MMSALDKSIGDFVEMLKARSLWDDTLLWVTTDNGGMTQYINVFPGSASSNFPLRAGKTSLFEGGVRGISFISGGLLPSEAAGKEYRGLLQHVDIPATLATMGSASMPGIDGLDVWEAIVNGSASPRTEVPLNVDRSRLAKLCSLQQLIIHDNPPPEIPIPMEQLLSEELSPSSGHLSLPQPLEQNYSALIHGDWKLINGFSGFYDGYWSNDPYLHTEADFYTQGPVRIGEENVWLFNLSTDEEERHNVAASHVDVVLRMQERLRELSDPRNGYRVPQQNLPHPQAKPVFHNGTWAPWRESSRVGVEYV